MVVTLIGASLVGEGHESHVEIVWTYSEAMQGWQGYDTVSMILRAYNQGEYVQYCTPVDSHTIQCRVGLNQAVG